MKQTIAMKQAALRNLCGSMASSTSERLPTTGALSTSALAPDGRGGLLWPMESTYKIMAHISYGVPIIQHFEDGHALGTRDNSSPKRAINAIREILRCAGTSCKEGRS